MPLYTYALVSAFIWALSAQILNTGISHIPDTTTKNILFKYVLIGIYFAVLFGMLILLPFVSINSVSSLINFNVFLVGLFTYPLATGFYYLSGIAFNKRMELASQFAKVKPIFTLAISVFLLKEILSTYFRTRQSGFPLKAAFFLSLS